MQSEFTNTPAQRRAIFGGGLLLTCISLLALLLGFMVFRESFAGTPFFVQNILALFAVLVVQGAFIWLVYGFTRAFSSALERLIALAGLLFLVAVMLMNIVTHWMLIKRLPLWELQQAWLSWGAVTVFIGILIFVLLITLADPVWRLVQMERRYEVREEETVSVRPLAVSPTSHPGELSRIVRHGRMLPPGVKAQLGAGDREEWHGSGK